MVRDLGAPGAEGRSTLLFFLSPTCPVCKALLPVLRQVARARATGSGSCLPATARGDEHEAFVRAERLEAFRTCSPGARHHLPGGEAALRGAARRVGRRARARAREHTRAPREPVRGQGARRGVDPGFPPRRGGARRSGCNDDGRTTLARPPVRTGDARARARTSRRSFLTRLGTALAGTRRCRSCRWRARRPNRARRCPTTRRCTARWATRRAASYWRHCAIDGFLCSCCGGSQNACPPGTEMSPLTWIGTCRNPGDGKDYIISYNDCCGQSLCMRCRCTRTEGERPLYLTMKEQRPAVVLRHPEPGGELLGGRRPRCGDRHVGARGARPPPSSCWRRACRPRRHERPALDYAVTCQGCHRADGAGTPGTVPALAGSVGKFLRVPGGREFLVRVPGVAQAPLDDTRSRPCSTGCSTASAATTCRRASSRTRRRR